MYSFDIIILFLVQGAQKAGSICKKQFKSVDQVDIAGST